MLQRYVVLSCLVVTFNIWTILGDVRKRSLLPNDKDLFQELRDKLTALEIRLSSSTYRCDGNGFRLNDVGSIYTRWGRLECPANITELIYSGYMGGSFYSHKGGAVNHLCLPKNPDSNYKYKDQGSGARGFVFGAEYDMYDNDIEISQNLLSADVPCAVCRAVGSSSILMIPGKTQCEKSWTNQYTGYLMSGRYDQEAASQYICVDKNAEKLPGLIVRRSGAFLYPVETRCGSLKCPPYVEGRELPCVVCSK